MLVLIEKRARKVDTDPDRTSVELLVIMLLGDAPYFLLATIAWRYIVAFHRLVLQLLAQVPNLSLHLFQPRLASQTGVILVGRQLLLRMLEQDLTDLPDYFKEIPGANQKAKFLVDLFLVIT